MAVDGAIVRAQMAETPDAALNVLKVLLKGVLIIIRTQLDGSKAKALVAEHCVGSAAIDLDEVFQEAKS